jgi:ribosomal protein S18 acetylase RimI-like enzyme
MKLELIPFQNCYAKSFAQLNYNWMKEFDLHEQESNSILENPALAIANGANIFLAKVNSHIIGTVALLEYEQDGFELVKLTVDREYRGKKIGKRLVESAILFSKEKGKTRLLLESSTKLKAALSLYKSMGFREIQKSTENQCDIRMQLIL